ncbi:MAG: PadR family transcriptional regulator [Proteobacteria bacterium]|nr:PadR family transcriptional regulator [Pseudomonadota bacterium]
MIRDIELAFIKVHILYHANKERVFGIGLIQELAEHGYVISPGTLYPILNKLEKQELLVSEKQTVDHKQRKYYRITAPGEKILKDMKNKVSELYREVLP